MQHRAQRTLRRAAEVCGIGFLTGADVTLRFLPAPPDHGIAFRRTDCPGSAPVPALVDYTLPRQRRTAIGRQGVVIELVEHVLAALAGLRIDNCLVELDAPEPPGCDGSAWAFASALLEAGFCEQDRPRPLLNVASVVKARTADCASEVVARPSEAGGLTIGYLLDYGPRSPIPRQTLTVEITPETFLQELAFARTFVLESEVAALRAQGYGPRTTAHDLLIYGPAGVIDNELRAEDECVRHKILDCLGDYALLGCDLAGHVSAYRSGHQLNCELARRIRQAHAETQSARAERAA